MTRQKANELLETHVSTDWLRKHSLATAAVMESLAPRFGADPERWYVTGLLHDLDFDYTQDPAVHGLRTAEILREHEADDETISLIMSHNAEGLGLSRSSAEEHVMTAAETVTGLIVATALVMPDRKLASVEPASVVKRMKKKDFARNVSRERILECKEAGIPLDEFVGTAVRAMQGVSGKLGL